MDELKPCPFWGDPMKKTPRAGVQHKLAGKKSAPCILFQVGFESVDAWNTRPDLPRLPTSMGAALRSALEDQETGNEIFIAIRDGKPFDDETIDRIIRHVRFQSTADLQSKLDMAVEALRNTHKYLVKADRALLHDAIASGHTYVDAALCVAADALAAIGDDNAAA